MTTRRKDLVSSAVLTLTAIVIHLQARGITARFKTGVDSGFFPEIVTALMGVLAFAIGVRAFFGPSISIAQPPAEGQLRVFAVLAAIAAALLAMPVVGFLSAAAVLLFAQMVLLTPKGGHRLVLKSVLSVVMATAIWAVFTMVFGLSLPSGPF